MDVKVLLTNRRCLRTYRASSADISPIHIYRGHTKAITSVAISADKCFSASLDSTIRSYKVVPMDREAYSRTGMEAFLFLYISFYCLFETSTDDFSVML